MTTAGRNDITLTMRGARAERGVSLSDFEAFISSFLAALRDYDLAGRGGQTKKSGHPDRRSEAATAFKLVGFRTGSGVATLEPEIVNLDDEQLPIDEQPLSLTTLTALTADLVAERPMPEAVLESLGKACRAAGRDGSLTIGLPRATGHGVVVDADLLERVARVGSPSEIREMSSVSGRLHLLDLEPDRLGIRAAGGIEWSCRYPAELETRVKSLLDRSVWVEGSGRLTSPLRGAMTIKRIEAVGIEQSPLFTVETISDLELSAQQGIAAPQGLAAISNPEWDDETDDAYLAALLGK